MSSFVAFTTYIDEHAESLANEAVEVVLAQFNKDIPAQEKEQAIIMYIELVGFFGKALVQEKQENVPASFIEWSKKNAEMQIASNGKISEIVIRYQPTRVVFTEILTRIGQAFTLTVEENASTIKLFNYIMDISLNETVYTFERLSEEYKKEMDQELLSLSAPIVPIKEGVVVLPLVGAMDERRVQALTDTVIPKISEMEIDYVIVDFSGLLTINPHVAIGLHQVGNTLRLIGIQVLSTGLRPNLVQVAVNSGIKMSAIRTFASVKQALESLQ